MRNWLLSAALLLVLAASARAETVDRIVVSIGATGITQSEVDREVRFAQFLDGQPQSLTPSEPQRIEARSRLLEQTLLAEEADADPAGNAGIEGQAIRVFDDARNLYPDEASYGSALASTGYNAEQVFQRLVRNVKIIRLINRRLRPNAWADRREIEAYYKETFVPDFVEREKTPSPMLEEVETFIRETLTQREVDQLLDQWLNEIQSTRRVKVHTY